MSEQRPDRPARKNGRPQPGGANNGGMRFGRGLFGWVLFIGLAVMLFVVLQNQRKTSQEISLSEFVAQADNGNIAKLYIDGETLRGETNKEIQVGNTMTKSFRTEIPAQQIGSFEFTKWVLDHAKGSVVKVENSQSIVVNLLLPLIP